jgi:predicted component of type VI protein secretion system
MPVTASFKKDTILKAFEATGLSPLQPEVILKRFDQPPQSGQSSDSDSSALSASNWRKIERLLREIVTDRSDPRAQKLSQAFHQISVQKSLLTHEAQGLRQALINER